MTTLVETLDHTPNAAMFQSAPAQLFVSVLHAVKPGRSWGMRLYPASIVSQLVHILEYVCVGSTSCYVLKRSDKLNRSSYVNKKRS